MKGTAHHIGLKIGEIKTHLQKENNVKAYQALLDLEEEFYERNEEIEDIDVSNFFNQDNLYRARDIPTDIEKARLIVGYINDE